MSKVIVKTMRFDPPTFHSLKELAKDLYEGNLSQTIRQLIREKLEDMEEVRIYDRRKKTSKKTISLAELRKSLS